MNQLISSLLVTYKTKLIGNVDSILDIHLKYTFYITEKDKGNTICDMDQDLVVLWA